MATQEELHQAALKIGRANPEGRQGASKYLKRLDYSVLQQCIHCGMCLPTCPTYNETKLERNGPRGRIALMRRIADGHLEVTQAFGQELYFCLGCLACETACPAGVRYGEMFEQARADIEQVGVLRNRVRDPGARIDSPLDVYAPAGVASGRSARLALPGQWTGVPGAEI